MDTQTPEIDNKDRWMDIAKKIQPIQKTNLQKTLT